MVRWQHCGQLSGRVSNYAHCDTFSIYASSPNRPQITQIAVDLEKRNLHFREAQAAGL
jgi:hypothetical protein